jgi:hypothetical protein
MNTIYLSSPKISTACSQKSLAAFVASVRAYHGSRGEVINIIRELCETTDQPIAWSNVARAIARRNADHLIMPARALWAEYRKSASVVPRKLNRGRHEDVVRSS